MEVLEQALPEMAPEDNVFRLALTTLKAMEPTGATKIQASTLWLPVTYFSVWMCRLLGWWPELGHCAVCGLDLREAEVWWSPVGDGVTCMEDRRSHSRALSLPSVHESYRMARTSLAQMLEDERWPPERAADLRAFALAMLERHLDRRLRSAAVLH